MMRFFLSVFFVAAGWCLPVSAFVSHSGSTSSDARVYMKPDGFSDWMQPDGQDYDTHPHPLNTPRRPASALEQWQQRQFELKEQQQMDASLMNTQQQLNQWQQAQEQTDRFVNDPYGTNGPARYGYNIGPPPPPQQQMRQQQQPPAPQQQQFPPQQQQPQMQQPPQQQMQSRPPRQQSPMDQFIENPYGNRPAPDGYYDQQGGSPGSYISASTARFDQNVREQQNFMENTSGTNRMEYGFGTSSKESPGKVVVPAPNRRNKRKQVSRLDNFINNPRGSTFTAGQYGYGNDGDNEGGYYNYYNDGGPVP